MELFLEDITLASLKLRNNSRAMAATRAAATILVLAESPGQALAGS